MKKKSFYDSVDIPIAFQNTYKRIFSLRNLFQDFSLFSDELKEAETNLSKLLPTLENDFEEVESFTPNELRKGDLEKLFQEDIRPIVIRGYVKDYDCVKLWTPDFFKKNYGTYPIFYTSTQKIINDEGTNLADFISKIQNGDKSRAYIENMSDIFNAFPELHEQLSIEQFKTYFNNYASYHKVAQLFFGGLGTGASFHCANELNCFINIYGRKKWTFVHPKYAIAMKATLMNKGYFVGSFIKHRSPKKFREIHYPLYNRIPKLVVTLEPGDILLNPPWWWHAIDNKTNTTIAVATRWRIDKEYIQQNPCYDLFQSMRIDQLNNFSKKLKDSQVVMEDKMIRKNYASYKEMGWKEK